MEDTTNTMEDITMSRLHGSYCCGGCGCAPTGGTIRPRMSLVPGGRRRGETGLQAAGGVSTCRSSSRRRGTWSRGAAWSILLLTLLHTVTTTTQQSTTTPAAVTAACRPIFQANVSTDVFKGACEDIAVFPCVSLTALQMANPADCSRQFTCGNFIVFDCPCAPGLMWNTTQGTCVPSFYANCTCPDGRAPPTPKPTPGSLGGNNTALIAGVVVGVLVIIILIIVIVLLMKRRQAQQARPMTPSLGPQYSVKSMNYEDINDLKRQEAVYDNGPTFETAEYDNHGFGKDKEAIRARTQNATVKSTTSTISAPPPPLPGGHPTSMKSMANGVADEDEEPEYMETV